eukprot:751382-Hanusia_phi.AAC.3
MGTGWPGERRSLGREGGLSRDAKKHGSVSAPTILLMSEGVGVVVQNVNHQGVRSLGKGDTGGDIYCGMEGRSKGGYQNCFCSGVGMNARVGYEVGAIAFEKPGGVVKPTTTIPGVHAALVRRGERRGERAQRNREARVGDDDQSSSKGKSKTGR